MVVREEGMMDTRFQQSSSLVSGYLLSTYVRHIRDISFQGESKKLLSLNISWQKENGSPDKFFKSLFIISG